MSHTPALMTVEAAAKHLSLSVSFLNKARLTGLGPAFVKLGRRVAYTVADLDRWIEAGRRQSTSQTAVAH